MDALYFLKSRTAFIRLFYSEGSKGFSEVMRRIEDELPPFDDPPYSETGEPPYLEQWLDAHEALNVLGIACVSLLSDTLKLYFETLRTRVIGFEFENSKAELKGGFVPAYLRALAEILNVDWDECPADLAIVEQIVLARNRGQHGGSLTSLLFEYDKATIDKYPRPYFVSIDESAVLSSEAGSLMSLILPTVRVTRDAWVKSVDEVEKLAGWIDERLNRAHAWRTQANS